MSTSFEQISCTISNMYNSQMPAIGARARFSFSGGIARGRGALGLIEHTSPYNTPVANFSACRSFFRAAVENNNNKKDRNYRNF